MGCNAFYSVLQSLWFSFAADSKTLKEEKREELFENLKADESIGWDVDIIDARELSAKMLKKLVLESHLYFQSYTILHFLSDFSHVFSSTEIRLTWMKFHMNLQLALSLRC